MVVADADAVPKAASLAAREALVAAAPEVVEEDAVARARARARVRARVKDRVRTNTKPLPFVFITLRV